MKKFLTIIALGVCCVVYGQSINQPHSFYYGLNGSKNEISLVQSKIAICKDTLLSKKEFLQNLSITSKDFTWKWKGENVCVIEVRNITDLPNLRNRLLSKDNNISMLSVYEMEQGAEIVAFPEIVVKAKNKGSIEEKFIRQYNLSLKEDKGFLQIYSIPTDNDVLKVANQLYETGEFTFSYPHFLAPYHSCAYIPNDTYFQYQLALHNIGQSLPNGHTGTIDADINAPEAWEITMGSLDVIVAVFDQGVTSDHPDLPNTRQVRLNGSNFGWGNPNNPSPSGNNNHGNACAGAIAASINNNEGIAGVAPNCRIMPLRKDDECYDTDLAAGIRFAVDSGANIISCSWALASYSPTASPAIVNAIQYAIEHNVVVVCAAGNTANHESGNDGGVYFPANIGIPGLIAVGASDRYDHVANYSPISSLIDIVAPSHRAYPNQISGEASEMWTLDIPGNAGYNPIPYEWPESIPTPGTMIPNSGTNALAYTGCFGGTSYACPLVAGVAALMLSVNPYLTPTDVHNILKESSAKVGGYTYTNGRCNEMGYGRVDALAAVNAAKYKYIVGPDYFCDTTCFHLLNIPNGVTCQWSAHLSQLVMGNLSIISGQGDSAICIAHEIPTQIELNNDSNWGQSTRECQFDLNTYIVVTVYDNASSTPLYTVRKDLRNRIGSTPNVTVNNSLYHWLVGTHRSFTITNCTNEPDSVFYWEARRGITLKATHYGKSFNYTPMETGKHTISVTNLEKECGDSIVSFSYLMIPRVHLSAVDNGETLVISIFRENEGYQRAQVTLNDNSEYSLELWHSIYGRVRTQTALSASEQMNIHGLPQGTYVLLLKENGNVIAQTKVIIQ